eukprot:TRINITY_DN1830_c0_g1_i3.p2 TRINITY_DN1830_c0_g1~~TRINITY_DN1830_c0_g1_i3.p2  ORF type:complete len:165 (-),score=18.01 TRINITY_DN1830_c0_g1_i3:210-704(-)
MGKESVRKRGVGSSSKRSVTESQSFADLTSLMQDFNKFWNIKECVLEDNIKENGEVSVILRTRDINTSVAVGGFSNKSNEVQQLFKRLLELALITPETKLMSFLKLEENVWCKTGLSGCTFKAGDKFMLLLEYPGRTLGLPTREKHIAKQPRYNKKLYTKINTL